MNGQNARNITLACICYELLPFEHINLCKQPFQHYTRVLLALNNFQSKRLYVLISIGSCVLLMAVARGISEHMLT